MAEGGGGGLVGCTSRVGNCCRKPMCNKKGNLSFEKNWEIDLI